MPETLLRVLLLCLLVALSQKPLSLSLLFQMPGKLKKKKRRAAAAAANRSLAALIPKGGIAYECSGPLYQEAAYRLAYVDMKRREQGGDDPDSGQAIDLMIERNCPKEAIELVRETSRFIQMAIIHIEDSSRKDGLVAHEEALVESLLGHLYDLGTQFPGTTRKPPTTSSKAPQKRAPAVSAARPAVISAPVQFARVTEDGKVLLSLPMDPRDFGPLYARVLEAEIANAGTREQFAGYLAPLAAAKYPSDIIALTREFIRFAGMAELLSEKPVTICEHGQGCADCLGCDDVLEAIKELAPLRRADIRAMKQPS